MDTLYNGKNREIYNSFSVTTSTNVEQSHSGRKSPIQQNFEKAVSQASIIASITDVDFNFTDYSYPVLQNAGQPGLYSRQYPPKDQNPPKFISATQAYYWGNRMNTDARPRIKDNITKQMQLLDTGAATTIHSTCTRR